MKKIIIPILLLILMSCDVGNLFGGSENVLRKLEGDWTINLSNSVFDNGEPSYVEKYVTISFDTEGDIQAVGLLDSSNNKFEENRIDSVKINSSTDEGAFTATMTVFTPEPSLAANGNETYWTYKFSGSTLILEVFDDNTMEDRFVKFSCTAK